MMFKIKYFRYNKWHVREYKSFCEAVYAAFWGCENDENMFVSQIMCEDQVLWKFRWTYENDIEDVYKRCVERENNGPVENLKTRKT